MIRCGFCGHEFTEEEGIHGCRNCSVSCGRNMIKCPRCFYENPPQPQLLKKLKKLIKKDK